MPGPAGPRAARTPIRRGPTPPRRSGGSSPQPCRSAESSGPAPRGVMLLCVSGDAYPGGADEGRPIGRRAFLGIVGVGVSSLWWGGSALNLASQATRLVPENVRSAVPFGEGWRIYSVSPPYPRFEPATWRLRIDGLVAAPQELTYAQLRTLPRADQVSDFRCVTGWSVDNVHWTGVRFA